MPVSTRPSRTVRTRLRETAGHRQGSGHGFAGPGSGAGPATHLCDLRPLFTLRAFLFSHCSNELMRNSESGHEGSQGNVSCANPARLHWHTGTLNSFVQGRQWHRRECGSARVPPLQTTAWLLQGVVLTHLASKSPRQGVICLFLRWHQSPRPVHRWYGKRLPENRNLSSTKQA